MARLYHTPIDLNKNELRNAKIQNLGSAPGTPTLGQLYYDTGNNNLYVWDGAWTDLTVQGGGLSYGTPSQTIQAGDTAQAGVSANVLREDSQNAVATGIASSITGTAAEGSGTNLARADHDHAYGNASIPVGSLGTGVRLDTVNAPTASVNLNSQKITALGGPPTAATDAANKAYVDSIAEGLAPKDSVRAATTANIANLLTAAPNTLDGVTLAANDRILVKDQTTTNQNGIYTITTLGTGANGVWARATDMDTWAEVPGASVWVEQGTVAADTGWVSTADLPGTIGTTAITWTQHSGLGSITAGAGLTKTGNTLDVVGTASRINVAADAIDIHTSYVGQASITTLGTITTGTWNGTDIGIADGGTGQGTAKLARESGLIVGGYYSSATHGASTTISITAATHGLRASRGLIVQIQEESTGEVVDADIVVAANGDTTITFATSQTANTKRVTIVG